jgi:hypothetical protein
MFYCHQLRIKIKDFSKHSFPRQRYHIQLFTLVHAQVLRSFQLFLHFNLCVNFQEFLFNPVDQIFEIEQLQNFSQAHLSFLHDFLEINYNLYSSHLDLFLYLQLVIVKS